MLVAPDNLTMRYNLGCLYSAHLNDPDASVKVLGLFFDKIRSLSHVSHSEVDPDLDPLRNDPRFQKMVSDAKARLAVAPELIAAK